jgi:hypothetical protein
MRGLRGAQRCSCTSTLVLRVRNAAMRPPAGVDGPPRERGGVGEHGGGVGGGLRRGSRAAPLHGTFVATLDAHAAVGLGRPGHRVTSPCDPCPWSLPAGRSSDVCAWLPPAMSLPQAGPVGRDRRASCGMLRPAASSWAEAGQCLQSRPGLALRGKVGFLGSEWRRRAPGDWPRPTLRFLPQAATEGSEAAENDPQATGGDRPMFVETLRGVFPGERDRAESVEGPEIADLAPRQASRACLFAHGVLWLWVCMSSATAVLVAALTAHLLLLPVRCANASLPWWWWS